MKTKNIGIKPTDNAKWYDWYITLPSGKKAYKEEGKDPVVEDINELITHLLSEIRKRDSELGKLNMELGKFKIK